MPDQKHPLFSIARIVAILCVLSAMIIQPLTRPISIMFESDSEWVNMENSEESNEEESIETDMEEKIELQLFTSEYHVIDFSKNSALFANQHVLFDFILETNIPPPKSV